MDIIRQYVDEQGARQVWDSRDPDTPINFANGVLDAKVVDRVIAEREEAKLESEKQAAVDAALDVEFRKRKSEVADLYDKTPSDAVSEVFRADAVERAL